MKKDIENLIEQLTKVRPSNLSEEGLKLFNKINEIIDTNEYLEEENKKAYAKYYNARTCIDKFSKQTIPKLKIKERIEELETKLKVFEKDIRYCKDRVEARLMNDEIYVLRRCRDLLKELMED